MSIYRVSPYRAIISSPVIVIDLSVIGYHYRILSVIVIDVFVIAYTFEHCKLILLAHMENSSIVAAMEIPQNYIN